MKMDATLKRKAWKVAIAHFALSVFVGVVILSFFNAHGFTGTPEARLKFETFLAWSRAWASIWVPIFCLLQPHWWLADKFDPVFLHSIPKWIVGSFLFLSIPLWSICVARLFAKFDNWLNHFPVFGRKVF